KQNEEFEISYPKVCDTIRIIIENEKKFLEGKNLTYSHNGYFKASKSRTDLDREMGFVTKNELQG
ncbi:MAG TPA: hypothetical protein PK330_07470, partial [Sulfurovum sp.]|nr:hypothetical protein [Sulfurovum sp.]